MHMFKVRTDDKNVEPSLPDGAVLWVRQKGDVGPRRVETLTPAVCAGGEKAVLAVLVRFLVENYSLPLRLRQTKVCPQHKFIQVLEVTRTKVYCEISWIGAVCCEFKDIYEGTLEEGNVRWDLSGPGNCVSELLAQTTAPADLATEVRTRNNITATTWWLEPVTKPGGELEGLRSSHAWLEAGWYGYWPY